MSEFQYYEFQAVDRPLTAKEQEELRNLSSRAEITSRSFTNEYHYGNFRGKVDEVLERYFDAFLYRANWGTNRLMFRVPRAAADPEKWKEYILGDNNKLKVTDRYVIVSLQSVLEGGEGWIEGEGDLDDLLPVREQLLAGDLRGLYLGWLSALTDDMSYIEEADEEIVEPPVPPGLAKLDDALEALADFLRVDEDLLAAAALASGELESVVADEKGLAEWVKAQPAAARQEWLVRLLGDDTGTVRREVLSEWRKSQPRPQMAEKRRTVAELRAIADNLEAERNKQKAAAAEKERKRKEQERAKYLDGLVGQEERLLKQAEELIAAKKAGEYDQAVTILSDLRDLVQRRGTAEAYGRTMAELAGRHAKKSTLLKRLRGEKLIS